MIAPRNPLEANSESAAPAASSAHAEHLRRQRLFQQESQQIGTSNCKLTSILVPAENSEELEQLVCRMD